MLDFAQARVQLAKWEKRNWPRSNHNIAVAFRYHSVSNFLDAFSMVPGTVTLKHALINVDNVEGEGLN